MPTWSRELEKKPITGLGILVPWEATNRPLPIEHEDAREYVHFAALWWWMKLGILGLLAYPLLLLSIARLAWKVWRKATEGIVRAFGLASLCGIAGLLVAETTATFTGAELRFTVVLGVRSDCWRCSRRQIVDRPGAAGGAREGPGGGVAGRRARAHASSRVSASIE